MGFKLSSKMGCLKFSNFFFKLSSKMGCFKLLQGFPFSGPTLWAHFLALLCWPFLLLFGLSYGLLGPFLGSFMVFLGLFYGRLGTFYSRLGTLL